MMEKHIIVMMGGSGEDWMELPLNRPNMPAASFALLTDDEFEKLKNGEIGLGDDIDHVPWTNISTKAVMEQLGV